ncbi:MAG: SMC-Scp complex subunit ScpB [Actinomycetia bacterium]|nr:SMC-Scp complex subunit ScpB [Actinomycetes bacterium]
MVESKRAIEAILMVASDPTPTQLLAQLIELPVEEVDQLCRELALGYDMANHGFQLVEVAGGWRYQTHPDLHPYVERFAMDGQSTRLSTAALETLAIVAYKQPISRAQVSAIRGVNVDAVLRTLVQRGYVEEVGRDVGAGQAILFGTTSYFLERIGLNETGDLPALGDFVPSAEVVEALEQTLKVEVEVDPDLDAPDDGATESDLATDAEGAASREVTIEEAPVEGEDVDEETPAGVSGGSVDVDTAEEADGDEIDLRLDPADEPSAFVGEALVSDEATQAAVEAEPDEVGDESTESQPPSIAESIGNLVARVDLAPRDHPVVDGEDSAAEAAPMISEEPPESGSGPEPESGPELESGPGPEPPVELSAEPAYPAPSSTEEHKESKPAADPVGDH